MRTIDTRPPLGERSQTLPGGEGNGGEGRESFSADANRDGAGTTSSNVVADLVFLRDTLRMANEGGATAPTGTYPYRPTEIRQKVEMLAWSEKFESGQSVVSAFRLFRGSVLSWVLAEGLMDVLKGESIPVGLPDVDLSRLRSCFGEERVAKSLKLWSQFI